MTEQTFGNVTAAGTDGQVALVAEALSRIDPPLHEKLRRAYRIEFHTPAEFRAMGYVFANGKVNWGRVAGNRVLWVNAGLAINRPWAARYVVVHEIAHAIDADWLDSGKRAELLALMGDQQTTWRGGPYAKRASEVYADALTEAVGIVSPLDDFYGDIENLSAVIDITFRPATPPVPDDTPPDPLPLPDPRIAALEAALAAEQEARGVLENRIKAIAVLATQ